MIMDEQPPTPDFLRNISVKMGGKKNTPLDYKIYNKI